MLRTEGDGRDALPFLDGPVHHLHQADHACVCLIRRDACRVALGHSPVSRLINRLRTSSNLCVSSCKLKVRTARLVVPRVHQPAAQRRRRVARGRRDALDHGLVVSWVD